MRINTYGSLPAPSSDSVAHVEGVLKLTLP
ncbi:hypothetical protein R75465_08501 [Paraburkholderia aspalathi]|nr:hypothetical protein R75465_08501 [Paraburkholderia aspalathi]